MLSSQLFWRMFLVYAALTVSTALAFVIVLSARSRDSATRQAQQRLREDAAAIQRLLELQPQDLAQARQVLTAVAQERSTRAVLQTVTGERLWSSPEPPAPFPDAETAPEVLKAVQSGEGFAWRKPARIAGEWLYFAVLVARPPTLLDQTEITNGSPAGATVSAAATAEASAAGDNPSTTTPLVIWLAVPMEATLRELSATDARIWLAVGVFALLALGVTYVVVGRIIEPLATLTAAAEQIAAGQTDTEVPVQRRNELGALARAFNVMSRQLRARLADLQSQRTALVDNNERLETVLGTMAEGVIAVDERERIVLANPAAVRMLELNPSTMLGRPLWEAARQSQWSALIQQSLHGEAPPRVEFEIARTQTTISVTASRLPGEPCHGVLLVLHDVTELRRLENLRREFVQNVSHELKTPLSSIAAYADTLLEGGLDDPQHSRTFVTRIIEQSDRLHTLILDLLALARMEASEANYDVLPTNVSAVIHASLDAHLQVAAAKRLRLIAEPPATDVWGLADDEGLRTILDNLLDNAVNYTPEGGRIVVRWRTAVNDVTIEVEDTGVGIAKEHQQRIFERFFRIDKARSRELGGTGLGLAIVKHLCQMFGGSVKVSSQLGQGTTFTIRLRAATEEAAFAPPVER